MTAEIEIKVEAIDHTSPHLPTVIALGRANKKTLGFLTDSAFDDYAKKQRILVAIEPQGKCIGYVMYSRPRHQVTIVHLCIDNLWRGLGVAKKLVDYLSQTNRAVYGISLSCRRDYEVSKMWPKLGFVAKGEKPGRSRDGKPLTSWWFDHGHPNLFSKVATQSLASKLRVVLDADVFFNLNTENEVDSEESQSLLADWVQGEVELYLTDEIDNEINRNVNSTERKKQWHLAQGYQRITCKIEEVEINYNSLKSFFPAKMAESDESDRRQLARAIASDVQFFVTRDNRLLEIAEEIYKSFGLLIMRPTSLILQIDEYRKQAEYEPVRFAGKYIEKRRINRGPQETILTECFQFSEGGETKDDFQRRLRQFLCEPERFECFVFLDGEKKPLALIVYDRQKEHELEVPMLRVGHSPLAATITRNLIIRSISLSAREQRPFTRIAEPYLEKSITAAIQSDAFVRVENGWLKANLAVTETASQLSLRLNDLASKFGREYEFCRELANILNVEGSIKDCQTMAEIERYLWPAKIIDADIPTFIIPIKPKWAHELFDEELAKQTLFGFQKPELALSREAVYYRASWASGGLKPGLIGRILWYVSYDKHSYHGGGHVRACSRLDEVVIGKPKELFRRFQRLGIYEWENIFNVAKNDNDRDIMAIIFSDTEPLRNPISLKNIQKNLGQESPIQSPRRISKEIFEKFYTLGTET